MKKLELEEKRFQQNATAEEAPCVAEAYREEERKKERDLDRIDCPTPSDDRGGRCGTLP